MFEEEIHRVIVDNQLFKPGERIAIGASGGKGNFDFASVFWMYSCAILLDFDWRILVRVAAYWSAYGFLPYTTCCFGLVTEEFLTNCWCT